jgi:hypothetical protein
MTKKHWRICGTDHRSWVKTSHEDLRQYISVDVGWEKAIRGMMHVFFQLIARFRQPIDNSVEAFHFCERLLEGLQNSLGLSTIRNEPRHGLLS